MTKTYAEQHLRASDRVLIFYLDTCSLDRVSMATGSLDSTTSRSNLLSVWHWVSDSFRCFKRRDRRHRVAEKAPEPAGQTRGRGPHPDVRRRGGGVEELADDVGGGGDAEDDGADDLLPPGQQQDGILPPAAAPSSLAPLDQANGGVAPLPVAVAVGEGVAVVWKEPARTQASCCGRSVWVKAPPPPAVPFTVWVLEDGERSVAVLVVRELVIVETLVKLV